MNSVNLPTGVLNTVVLGQGVGSAFTTSTATYPPTTTINQLLYSSAANAITGLTTGNNGLLITSSAGVPSILGGPGTSGNILQSNAAASPSFSTTTYPSTNAINTLLYASAANVMSALATANSGVLITSAGGVPSISSTLPPAVQGNITSVGALASGSLAAGFTPVTVPIGGTGLATATAYAVLCGGTSATGAFQSIASVGTSGQVLTSNGAGALPTFQSGPSSQTGRLLSFQIFTTGTAQTYTKNISATTILVECLGGGGGGGGCSISLSNVSAAGGGASGGYCRKWITSAASTYTYTVGGGGAGGAAGTNPGTAGSATTFSTLSAGGGGGGGGGNTNTTGNAAPGGSTATVSGGDFNATGNPGHTGVAFTTFLVTGAGGAGMYGGGANPVTISTSTSTAGNAATNYGSGGSGAGGINVTATQAGGAGSTGLIIVWEYS